MPSYKNISGSSGILSYGLGKDYIKVVFKDGGSYVYSFNSAGKQHVLNMQKLAEQGEGLATYINQHVKDHYEKENQ